MDEAKLRFLFGTVPEDVDLGDDEERDRLWHADRPELDGDRPSSSLHLVVVNQILDGEPTETWATAERLLDRGIGRHEVLDQLVLALIPSVQRALLDEQPFDPKAYAASLRQLPLPGPVAVFGAYLDVAREHVAVGAEKLTRLVVARLGLAPDDPVTEQLMADTDRALLEDSGSPVTMLAPDVVVHIPAITDGIVLTHRLSAAEHAQGYLDLDTDLAGFLRCPEPRVPEGPLYVDGPDGDDPDGGDPVSWSGPTDWLADLPLGALLAVRVTGDGAVTVSVLAAEPVAPPGLVEALRTAYDAEVEEPWLPVSAEEIVVGMLYRDRSAFAEPRPPLTELAVAAGLEQRGHEFAHEESVWEADEDVERQFRLMRRLDAEGQPLAAMKAFALLTWQADDPAALRRALDQLQDPDVLLAVTDELLGPDDTDPGRLAALVALADRLVAAAGSASRAAVAGWVAAVAAERDGRVLDAESHLRAASLVGAGWPFVEDRLAWYESDRGDAAAALGRWQGIGTPAEDPDVAAVLPFAEVAAPVVGRNQRCWCGSGRKFKQCHLGKPALAPLRERVGWLHHKAVAYLGRRGGDVEDVVDEYAETLAGDTGDVDKAFDDPLVSDTVLHEGGWFERFLADRGPLLPADEALLAASWLLVDRTVYEVVAVRPGADLTVRDLRTGNRLDVTERTPDATVTSGALLCARAVPDGVGHQFVGAVLTVPPGRERHLLELLDDRDGLALLDWMAAATAPPVLTSTDGEPLLACTAVLRVPAAASELLDAHFDPTDEGWASVEGDGRVLGTLELDGDELIVRTITEARMDRFLDELSEMMAGGSVLSDERHEIDVAPPKGDAEPAEPFDPAVLEELQDGFERRWCDEDVPALDGLTPRVAAADPTRRADVVRLIASFPDIDPATGAFGLRPHRLRELLGL